MLRRKRVSGQQPAAAEAQKQAKAPKSHEFDLETAVLGFQDNALNVVLGQVGFLWCQHDFKSNWAAVRMRLLCLKLPLHTLTKTSRLHSKRFGKTTMTSSSSEAVRCAWFLPFPLAYTPH